MSHDYAMSRVRDALEKSGGNHLKAQRLILSLLEKDHSLLLGLVSPHLHGIIAHALQHADAPSKKEQPTTAKRVVIDSDAGEFGAALVSSLKGARAENASFGEATPKNISKPGKASKAHVDAINQLINARKSNTDDKKKK